MSSRPPYLPFLEGGPSAAFRWRLGVRPLDLADWFEWTPDADDALAMKVELNERYPDTVFAVLDDIECEADEVASEMSTHLAHHHPHRRHELDDDLHPLDAAARLVPEDVVIMVERDGRLVFGGGSVCFPNRWDLRSKLGRTLSEVHAPVALLNDQLEDPIDGFFERLRPERSYWRLGWGIIDTADRYTPVDGTADPRPPDPAPGALFLRVERETLRRLPLTGVVVFTIRTHVTPIDVAVSTSATRSALAASLEAMPLSVRDYKGLADSTDRLIDHLRTFTTPLPGNL